MKLFLLNLLLALAWAGVNASFSGVSIAVGFVLGYLVIMLMRPALGPSGYYLGLWRAVGFTLFYVWELVLSSVRVATDVITPTLKARPGILAYPLEAETDAEITTFANLVSLTPGTLSLDVSDDHKTLYIHAMYLDDGTGDEQVADLKERFERRVLRLFRSERES